MKRHRFKQDRTLGEQLIEEARLAREKVSQLPPAGEEREDLLKKVREADVAAHIDEWLNSPGSKAPDPKVRPPQLAASKPPVLWARRIF
jgi:hypothetical protein